MPDGTFTDQKTMKRSAFLYCPQYMAEIEHYREDGTCKCDDENETVMAEWGYRWDKEKEMWV